MWLTMLGNAYIHSNRLILLVSNSNVLSICCMVTGLVEVSEKNIHKGKLAYLPKTGAKVAKNPTPNSNNLLIFAACFPKGERQSSERIR